MNNLLEKNIGALLNRNPELAKQIQSYIPNDVPQLKQEKGAFNLTYKGIYIHNPQNPLLEATSIFAGAKNEPDSIHLVFGLGLGYLFQFVSQNSKGTVILYEPDMNILRLVFSLVDFSNDILKNNVYLTNSLDGVTEILYQKSGMQNSPEMLFLPTQRQLQSEIFNDTVRFLQERVGSFKLDLKYTKQKFYPSLRMLLQNIPNIIEEIPFICLKDKYKDKTALIISAGPTLDRNIETIKENRNKFIIITVGTALKTLYANNIKPDFVCVIETFDSSKQLAGLDLSDVNFITEPYSHPNLRNFKFKQRFSHISANTPINHLWAEIIGENIEEYWSKGTVSYTALNCARILGCKKIILVGQDLAYIEGQCYSKDSAYKDLFCGINPETQKWEIQARDIEKFADEISPSVDKNIRIETAKRRLRNLNSSLYLVKGINGDMIPTESVYAAFVTPLKEFAEQFNDREYINTSLVGAQIDGFKNISLVEALKDSQKFENVSLDIEYKYDKECILKALNDNIEQLKGILPTIENGLKAAKSLKNDLTRYRNAGVEVLKSLKKLSVIYLALSSDFTNKSMMFDFITTAERIDVDYAMKMTQGFTYESVSKICNEIVKYFETAKIRINEIETLVRNVNENISTKS